MCKIFFFLLLVCLCNMQSLEKLKCKLSIIDDFQNLYRIIICQLNMDFFLRNDGVIIREHQRNPTKKMYKHSFKIWIPNWLSWPLPNCKWVIKCSRLRARVFQIKYIVRSKIPYFLSDGLDNHLRLLQKCSDFNWAESYKLYVWDRNWEPLFTRVSLLFSAYNRFILPNTLIVLLLFAKTPHF